MKHSLFALALSLGATPAAAQVTVAPEVSALMAACTPTDARAEDVLTGLRDRGWTDPLPEHRREALMTLAAAHLWSFLPERTVEAQQALLGELTDAIDRTTQGGGTFLTLGDERALILWDGDNLSCVWAGPETSTLDTLAVQLGGGFPASAGTATRTHSQRLEAGGRNWQRGMALGRTPIEALPPEVAAAAITDAARLDRSPD